MRKLYTYLFRSVIIVVLFYLSFTAYSQEATFFEGFDNTELGELPEGWSWYQKGGQNPLRHWSVSTYGWFGPKVAYSGIEGALEGMVDEDWLITPKITPAAGDFLIFDAAQTYTTIDYGTTYRILISTTGTDPDDFADTLITMNETEFPKYMETRSYDLSAYSGMPIHIAFVHETTSTDGNQTDDWYLDNVYVRPVQPAGFYRAEVSWQFAIPVRIGSADHTPLLGFKIRITGDEGVTHLSKLQLTTKGTTEDLHISKATMYTTHQDAFIAYGENGVNADVFGAISNPADTFEITGDQDLEIGDNYFWLAYTFNNEEQPEYPYPKADASLESVLVDDIEHSGIKDTVVVSPFIVPDSIPNDDHDDAIELTTSGRYGSYNLRATAEPEKEKLAYCAPDGYYDTSNSIWWHFTAPSEGLVTVDLSDTEFNTILLFMDKDSTQIACNDDIERGLNTQSKISDFPVAAGQEIYIRVTGMGTPLDPNGDAGIVNMDFSFTSLVTGIDGSEDGGMLSAPYPNPTSGTTALDIEPMDTRKVTIDIVDMMGRSVKNLYEGLLVAGEKRTINFSVSNLLPGMYLVQMRSDDSIGEVERLVVE